LSNSTNHGQGYLDHAMPEVRGLLGGARRLVFVPFALHDRAAYAENTRTIDASFAGASAAEGTFQSYLQSPSVLGNLTVGSSANQLEKLVDKWFLGLDRPAASAGYSQVSGQLFASGGPVYTDVHQGSLANCAFMSSLAETALRSSSTLTSMFIVNGDGTYSVRFFHGGVAEYVTVDSYLPGGGTVYARVVNSVLWVALAEKAYSQAVEMTWFGGNANAYGSIAYLYAYTTLGNITGQSTVAFTYTSGSSSQTALANAVSAGKLVCLISYTNAPAVVQNHAYAVVGYDAAAATVTLFNPWGIEYGLVTLSWADLQANFQYFDRTA
jgi:hypothetical protein